MTFVRTLAATLSAAFLIGAAPSHKSEFVPPAPPDSTTHHVAHINGNAIAYSARAGTITLRNAKEQISARMFYTAFTRDGADVTSRPVTFFYNGGPGSSTVWLRMGSFAPMRVETANNKPIANAPFHLVENSSSLIDKSDLVFVDAPNTGWSRVVGAGDPKGFMGIDQDARAFSQFVQNYISRFGRWNSPKFLFGESYGTTRDCVLVNMLQVAGVQINGVVLLSSILNFGLGGLGGGQPIGGGDWSYITYLPSEAATAWYHRKAGQGMALSAFLHEVENYAGTQYLHDLAQGADLSRAQFESDVSRLHRYLGLSEEYIRNANLRVSYPRFQQALLRNQDTLVGRYDGRYTTFDLDINADRGDWDPSDVGISGAFVALGNHYMRDTLKYQTNMQYRPTSYGGLLGARWDFKHNDQDPPTNVAPDLARAMTTNPHLYVFSGNGYYDFATPYFATQYTLQHLGLAPTLQSHITYGFYESGHMVYLNPAALIAFKADLARWYDRALSNR
ncbi:MAG: peptidase S10 [Candidatus Eremiobacteraeota bacterium]|nr:peptidase S10 [Candidatus Eremiobacteraeota bacterium]